MADRTGSLERLALELGNALREAMRLLGPEQVLETLARFGVAFPSELPALPAFATARGAVVGTAGDLAEDMQALTAAIEAEDVPQIIARGVEVTGDVGRLVAAFGDLARQLQAVGPTLPGVTPAQIAALAADFPNRMRDLLLADALDVVPAVGASLTFVGLVDRTEQPALPGVPTSRPRETITLRPDRLGSIVSGPAEHFRSLYDWGAAGFDGQRLLPAIERLVAWMGLPALYEPPQAGHGARVDAVALRLEAQPGSPPGLAVEALGPIGGAIDRTIQTPHAAWSARLQATGSVAVGATGAIRPPLEITLRPPTGELRGDAQLTLLGRPSAPFVLVGVAGASRLEVGEIEAALGLAAAWDSGDGQASIAPRTSGALRRGKLVIDAGQGDGFIAKLLSAGRLEAAFDVGATWTPEHGIQFTGSASLEIALPVHVALGPLEIQTIYLILGTSGTTFPLELSADMKASLGPLTAVVSRLGTTAQLSFPEGGGNVGPAQLTFAFKPPNGVGLAVTAGPVKGGGFLFIDAARGEYAGALELDFSGIVALKAIGLITTRMPDGSRGFSLLIIITAEFGTGLQLGFGFTLLGVGGILGLNRTMRLDALVEGVRTGAVNNILFPRDVVANAPRIISDLRTIFPPAEGRFLIGPMAKLGWGTPTLISLSLGIVIEIPGNIAILGVLRVALPTAEAALIVIQVSFVGAIEFDRKRVYFFASLFDSRVLFITLQGEMALVAAFAEDATFVLSVGGFHPRFQPPPLPVPTPRRISLDILNQANARITVQGYFAVTSNTLQFGARADVFFGFSSLNVNGHIGFDALIQFSPFHFIVEISASFSVRAFGVGLFSVRVRMSLEGPTPWHARGSGSISLLFFDIEVDFDITWGEARDTALEPIAVMPLLAGEVAKNESWTALPPTSSTLLVSLRRLEAADEGLVLHPAGALKITQRAVPLDASIDKVGNRRAADARRFSLVPGTGLAKRGDVLESFAPAQFREFSDAEKLAKPGFAPEHGGVELAPAGQASTSGQMIKRVNRYELTTIDTNFRRFRRRFAFFPRALFEHLLAGASIARSPLSQHVKTAREPFALRIEVAPEAFAVAFVQDNSPVTASFASEPMAQDFLASMAADDPSAAASMHVIPAFELAA